MSEVFISYLLEMYKLTVRKNNNKDKIHNEKSLILSSVTDSYGLQLCYFGGLIIVSFGINDAHMYVEG